MVRLRDFGDLGTDSSDQAMAVSPDGRKLVLQLRQGQPETNDYCTALVVLTLDRASEPQAIADTGDIVPAKFDMYGMVGLQTGSPVTSPLAWSPDGGWIAFVKTRAAGAEIWRIRPDGSNAALVTASPVPIDALAWTGAGSGLIFTARPAVVGAQDAIAREGLSGFHYDERFWPLASMTPYPVASSVSSSTQVVDLATGSVRTVTAAEASLADPSTAPTWRKDAEAFATTADGRSLAWTSADHPDWVGARPRLFVRIGAHDILCQARACSDVTGLWWMRDGHTLLFVHREGVARSQTGFYRWRPGGRAPRPLFVTSDAIFGCHQDRDKLLCAHETSLRPRDVVSIDGHTGGIRTLFDLNPEWNEMQLGRIERLTWRNNLGIETFGDLVLPVGYQTGQRVPLIVVQYESRGFLRGGTADDYPIQLYAAHGIAVLSFNRPPSPALQSGPKSVDDFLKINQTAWSDRRSVQSSLETIIGQLAARGIIDPARVGVTGQSDGASTATFALIHSRLFAAAALSTCCEDSDMMATLGEGFANSYADRGYPRTGQQRLDFWSESSLDLHADRPPVPILIQASELEARMALKTYTTLKNARWPIDMYVFPSESHVKLQPAHRLALFERSLAWFEKWLKPSEPVGRWGSSGNGQTPQFNAQASISTH